jgi:glycogen debranching enzyme
MGLDHAKWPIDALGSNIGHCLWTGIIDEDKAPSVAKHLLSDDMFSGWGIRTLAASMTTYNPMSYHNGSIWPHDNTLCAAGLMRYGFVEYAQQIASAILDVTAHFGHWLPELFCGLSRTKIPAPIPYPTSCSPQAWAAATPFLLLRTLLRFDPAVPSGRLWCAPVVPQRYLPLSISRVVLAPSHAGRESRATGTPKHGGGQLTSGESGRASAEARKAVGTKPSTTAAREDYLLRYLGAVCYHAHHGRTHPDEV